MKKKPETTMNEREEVARVPDTKYTGPGCLAQDYSNHPLDRRLYGRWRCYDGCVVLFNRSYQPLWARPTGEDGKSQ
jgi:hypothetical protein